MSKNKTAVKVRELEGWNGVAYLYELSEPVTWEDYDFDTGESHTHKTNYVVVSAVYVASDTSRPETFIFPCDSEGEVLSFGELEGSFRGDVDHVRALNDAGYEVIE